MGCILFAKMAVDLFLVTACVLLGSFPILTGGQSNRTVFSPSSTSGNSFERFRITFLEERCVSFDMIFVRARTTALAPVTGLYFDLRRSSDWSFIP